MSVLPPATKMRAFRCTLFPPSILCRTNALSRRASHRQLAELLDLSCVAGFVFGRIIDARFVENDLAAARLEAKRHVNQVVQAIFDRFLAFGRREQQQETASP